jgi:hypothetical protein
LQTTQSRETAHQRQRRWLRTDSLRSTTTSLLARRGALNGDGGVAPDVGRRSCEHGKPCAVYSLTMLRVAPARLQSDGLEHGLQRPLRRTRASVAALSTKQRSTCGIGMAGTGDRRGRLYRTWVSERNFYSVLMAARKRRRRL